MYEKKNSALPVRLTEDEKVQLSRIASETGLTSSTIIRLMIDALIKSYLKNGKIVLPISWEEISQHR